MLLQAKSQLTNFHLLRKASQQRKKPVYSTGFFALNRKGFEPLTHGLEGRCSIQLSYRSMCPQRVMGIEPTCSAWKADILPLNYTRIEKSEPEGIRTPDPRLRRPLLYPAELPIHVLTQDILCHKHFYLSTVFLIFFKKNFAEQKRAFTPQGIFS